MKIEKECKQCGKRFWVEICYVARGQGKFCSKSCLGKYLFLSGKLGKRNGINLKCVICENSFYRRPSEIKKGTDKFCSHSCATKGRNQISERHFAWKGNQVSYKELHTWVARWLGKPNKCELCGKSNLVGKDINWANKSGRYLRDLSDWIRLCVFCHRKYDKRKENLIYA